MDDLIGIAAVLTARFCPLRLYLDRQEEYEEPPYYAVCKQVSYHLGTPFEAEAVWDEVCTILPYAGEDERALFDQCVARCQGKEWPLFSDFDVPVTSARHGIRGTVDKVDPARPAFVLTRANEAPQAGVWGADRIRIACYIACVAESLGLEVDGGWVEYVPSGVLRYCVPGPRDRRIMLRAIAAAKKVEEGEVPKKPLNPPCVRCPHQERCGPGPRRLSDLL